MGLGERIMKKRIKPITVKYMINEDIHEVAFFPWQYRNENLMIHMIFYNDKFSCCGYIELTSNLKKCDKNKAYVPKNMIIWLEENRLAKRTGEMKSTDKGDFYEMFFHERALDHFKFAEEQKNIPEEKEVIIHRTCRICKRTHYISADDDTARKYEEYLYEGKHLIQNIFPDLRAPIRELLSMNCMCECCWIDIFGKPEEDS